MKEPNIIAVSKELKELKERVVALEKERDACVARVSKEMELLSFEHATREAVLQFIQELAEREGVAPELFVSRFEAAKNWHRDRFLQVVERVDPHIAAEIDDRKVADVCTEDFPPCIFPE
ncbi:MAG: hypothetical protein P4L99_09130 [Chthoniobacter sp.]|nr:hypothetical protein [Chthoniobacter sp.]